MNWHKLFTSRYTQFLESELTQIRERHRNEIEQINNTHALERERCINEANRGWAEADRLRQYLIPGLATSTRTVETSDSKEPPAKADTGEVGTPWQRIQRRAMKQQEEEARLEEEARRAKQFPTPKETPVPPA